jgi:glycosyltransferase involved in cell wall biosynthesis
MDHVVAVSEAQAAKVRACRVPGERLSVIRNAVDPERFTDPDPRSRAKLLRSFRRPYTRIIGAAGRLSPEKGFDVLVAAAEQVAKDDPSVGFILFGEGPCRGKLQQQIHAAGLASSFVLTGFRADLDRFLPHLDLLVLPSFTEGLPNIVLEAFASGVPVVATAVGGTPEVIEDSLSGYLVPARDANALAGRIRDALASAERLREMGFQGRQRVLEQFTFAGQAQQYRRLFERLRSASAASGGRQPPVKEQQADAPRSPGAETLEAKDLVLTGPTCAS